MIYTPLKLSKCSVNHVWKWRGRWYYRHWRCNALSYSKTSTSLSQYYTDDPALNNKDNINDFPANNNNSISFKFKQQITEQTGNGATKNVEIMAPLNYVSNFWTWNTWNAFNCENNLRFKWSDKCILVAVYCIKLRTRI